MIHESASLNKVLSQQFKTLEELQLYTIIYTLQLRVIHGMFTTQYKPSTEFNFQTLEV